MALFRDSNVAAIQMRNDAIASHVVRRNAEDERAIRLIERRARALLAERRALRRSINARIDVLTHALDSPQALGAGGRVSTTARTARSGRNKTAILRHLKHAGSAVLETEVISLLGTTDRDIAKARTTLHRLAQKGQVVRANGQVALTADGAAHLVELESRSEDALAVNVK